MLYLAIVVGAWLFYTSVSKEHKNTLFKTVGIIFGVVAFLFALLITYDKDQTASRKVEEAKRSAEQAAAQAQLEQFLAEKIKITPLGVSNLGPRKNEFGVVDLSPRNKFSVKICNRNTVELLNYTIEVSGHDPERSTFHGITGNDPEYTQLSSDMIVPPGKCKIDSWPGEGYSLFNAYPKYAVATTSAKWQ